jgi:nucleoside-diphosphate-sugar epimerase
VKVLLTGVSSFTGFWFASLLAEAGHAVTAPLRRNPAAYDGLRRRRLDTLPRSVSVVPDCAVGSDAFLSLVGSQQWDVFCHHGAQVEGYRSPDYDVCAAVAANTLNLPRALATMAKNGLRGVVLTGSVFEPHEGVGEAPLRAFSPYGLAKACTAEIVDYWAGVAGVAYGKFVVANPFGPYEEPRFCSYLFDCWRAGKVAEVRTPAYLRDNVPVRFLALAYARFVGEVAAADKARLHVGPSYYAESQGEFATRVGRETRSRSGWDCRLSLADQVEFPEPRARLNSNPIASTRADEQSFWDEYISSTMAA